MSYAALRRAISTGCLVFAFATMFPRGANADQIPGGFDLFDPLQGSQIFVPALGRLVPIVGVPIPSFPAFGSAFLGDTNSILQRNNPVSDGGPLQTSVEMKAMQLMSTDGSNLFFSLQVAPASIGVMNFQFGPAPNSGTFTWNIDVFFDVATGSFGGPSFTSFDVLLASGPSPWSNVAPPGAVCIPGLNCSLNGIDTSSDFFPIGTFTANGLNGTSIIFGTATVPEPGTAILLGTGVLAITIRLRSRHRSSRTGGSH